jgi:hypothetical protein
MESVERDPKTDPQTGDILRATIYTNGRERHVTGRLGSRVLYEAVSPTNRRVRQCTLRMWREWCERCKVEITQRGTS